MEKFWYPIIVLCLFAGGCSEEYDNLNGSDLVRKISVAAEDINGYTEGMAIEEVHALLSGSESVTLVVANWDDGFELELPVSVNSGRLVTWYDLAGNGAGITVSDTEARCAVLSLLARGSTFVYDIYYGSISADLETRVKVWYIYCDRDCRVTANTESGSAADYDLSFKKGWNRFAQTVTHTDHDTSSTLTTDIPTGLEWVITR